MSLDQALLEMELVGHDFYLFMDVEHQLPSVVSTGARRTTTASSGWTRTGR